MSKQNLVNLARHSNNIVPVPEIRGIYAMRLAIKLPSALPV